MEQMAEKWWYIIVVSVVSVFTALSVLTIPPVVGLAQYLMG